ncbi:MAG: glycosyltransferase family 4 protein, partial [Acidimicrobiia bacterium]
MSRRLRRLLRPGRLGRLEGAIDQPRAGELVSPARVEVAGWAASRDGPAARVEVHMSQAVVVAEIGLTRGDVASAYPRVADAGRAGWRAILDVSDQPATDADIEVKAMSVVGEEVVIGRVPVRFPTETRLVAARLDHPRPGDEVGPVLALYGWAITEPAPVRKVEVLVNGQWVGRARLGVLRRDVAGALGRRDALLGGFEHQIALADVLPDGAGTARVDVVVEATDGTQLELDSVEFAVRPQPDWDVEPDRLAELRARVAAAAPPPTKPKKHAPRVLVVTHELTLGGGQLYLFELLRNLVPLAPDIEWSLAGSRDGALVAMYEELGVPVHVQGDLPFWQAAAYEGRLEEMAAWAAPRRPDLVLANALVSFPGVDLADRLGVPAIWAIHESYPLQQYFWNIDPARPVSPAVLERAEAAFASAARVVFEADATSALFRRHGDPGRFVTVAYGIDLADIDAYRASSTRDAARAAHGFAPDATVLLCMGTIEARKSQTLLVRAFEAVAGRFPDAVLVLIGDRGDEHPTNVKEYVAGSPVADRIQILPIVTDTYEWYGLADALVSASDIESLPRSALESMAFELPVIAADAFGVPELLNDGRTGYVYAQRDLGALVAALDRFLSDSPQRRREVATAAAGHVRVHHDSKDYAQVYR